VARPPVLVLCNDPQLGDRIESAVAGAGGAPAQRNAGAALIVWADGSPEVEDTGAPGSAIVCVSERDLAGAVACLRDDRVVAVIHPAAIDRALEPTLARQLGGGRGDDDRLAAFTPGASFEELEIDDHDGRLRALDRVDRLAADHKMRRTARERIATTCEELLMNALYDAPVDDTGELVFADVEPADRLSMKSPRPVALRYGAAADQLAFSVTDRYGRLARRTVLDVLDKCMSSADPIDRKKLGSGLGLYMACSAAGGLMIDVTRGAATEVIATFGRDRTPLEVLGFTVRGVGDA
jgi:hypothetical protein